MATRVEASHSPRPGRSLAGSLAVLGLILLVLSAFPLFFQDAAADPAQPPAAGDAANAPVILLTGFEPFGKKKPPNPSWEGIKKLDGQSWKGHRLVCKQVPVVWGAPLEHLPGWVAEYQPVAIFAFGQGGSGYFAVESKASNARTPKAKDNRGERRPMPTIVEGGAEAFDASIACAKFVRALSDKGYRMRLSTRAGRYLCEEMLYSLEHLKATKKHSGTVMFCHVPSLDTHVPLNAAAVDYVKRWAVAAVLLAPVPPPPDPAARYQKITPAYVQQFVQDVLETWQTLYPRRVPAAAAVRSLQGKAEERPQDRKDIKEFIERYFSTWSKQDMKGYDACFMPDACIQHIDPKGRISTMPRVQFIASQRNYHRTSPVRTTEVAESVDIRFEEKLARVVVFWKLTAGRRVETGYDHFTLMRHEGQWRIVNLVFYQWPVDGKE
jgi:pyroglutamyl-peptidase